MSLAKFKWPDAVPIVTSKDMCKRILRNSKGQHCLLGMCEAAFEVNPYDNTEPVQMLASFIASRSPNVRDVRAVYSYNDNQAISLKQLADTWNEFVASLGYTEVFYVD